MRSSSGPPWLIMPASRSTPRAILFFAVFRTASDAVRAAVSIQRSLAAEPWPDERAVAVRMGVHTGQARRGGDSYIGLDVHLAARIAAAAHGGELLLSAATESLVDPGSIDGIALRDLGSHRLKDFDMPIRLWQVLIDGLRQEFPALRSLEAPVDLPAELTRFVGRAEEVRAIGDLLAQARLLTLTGAGGTGKTRLAVRVASDARSAFPDGVFFVDLGAVSDVTLVAPTIARTLGLQERPDRETLDLIARHLESRVVLLVLDNFEQLLGAVDVVDALLRASSRLKVLVTSRSRLGLAGEREYPVPPLAMPDPGATDPTASGGERGRGPVRGPGPNDRSRVRRGARGPSGHRRDLCPAGWLAARDRAGRESDPGA